MTTAKTVTISRDFFDILANKASIVDILVSISLKELVNNLYGIDTYDEWFTADNIQECMQNSAEKIIHLPEKNL